MPKPNLATYNPFKGWPPKLRTNVELLCGNPITLLTLATMHCYPEEDFTSTGLRKRLGARQNGHPTWTPSATSLLGTMKKLGYDSDLLQLAEEAPIGNRSSVIKGRITRQGQELGVGYTGPVLQFCLDNRGTYPQDLIGQKSCSKKLFPDGEPADQPFASSRLGLYRLLGTTPEAFSTTEASLALKLSQQSMNSLIRPLGQVGILTIHEKGGGGRPAFFQLADTHREPIDRLVSDIASLGNPDGIENGQKMTETIVDNAESFSYLMSLASNYIKARM